MQLLVRNRNLKPKISKIQSDQWTNKKNNNYEFNSKPFNTNTFAYQNPNSESIKKKKTSGLSGLVGLALRYHHHDQVMVTIYAIVIEITIIF